MNLDELRTMGERLFTVAMKRSQFQQVLQEDPDALDSTWLASALAITRNLRANRAETYGEEAELNQFLLRWASLAYPTFHLSADAAGAALLTDCGALVPADLQFPFPCFAIQLPSPSPIYIEGEEGLCEGGTILVQRYWRPVDGATGTALEVLEGLAKVPHEHLLRITILARGPSSMQVYTRIPCSAASMKEWLLDAAVECDTTWPGSEPLGLEDKRALTAAVRLVANTLVYVTSLRAKSKIDLEAPASRRKGGKGAVRQWKVPGPIKLSKELLAAARTTASRDPQWTLRSRFVVRGHWRNQPHGPGRAERSLRWIAPHWKGPEAGEVLERTYNVESAQ